MKYITTVNDVEHTIEIDQEGTIVVDGTVYKVDFNLLPEGGILSLLLNNHSLEAVFEERDQAWDVLIRGELYSVRVQDERAYRLAKARGVTAEFTGEAQIKSPMPGLIIAVPVHEGQIVSKGDQIVILESMKMENELRSPRDGIVRRLHIEPGVSVEKGQVLAVIGEVDVDGEESGDA